MKTYQIRLQKNYPIITTDDNKLMFVDLGQDPSFERSCAFQFMDNAISCGSRLGYRNPDAVSADLGLRIDGMIGRHELANYVVKFDYANRQLSVAKPSENAFNLPDYTGYQYSGADIKLKGAVNGKSGSILIDSGFEAIYVTDEVQLTGEKLSTIKDTDVMGEAINTNIHRVNAQVEHISFEGVGGFFPASDMYIFKNAVNVIAAIGYDLFSKATVIIDFPHKTVYLPNN